MHLLCLIDVLRKQAIHCHKNVVFLTFMNMTQIKWNACLCQPLPRIRSHSTVRGAVAMHCRIVCAIKALRVPDNHEIHLHCLLSSFQMLYPSLKDITRSYIFLLSCFVSCITAEYEQIIQNFSDILMKYPGQDIVSLSLWWMKPHSWPGKNIFI